MVKEAVSRDVAGTVGTTGAQHGHSTVPRMERLVDQMEAVVLGPGVVLALGWLAGTSSAVLDSAAIPATLGLALQIIAVAIAFRSVTALIESDTEAWSPSEPNADEPWATFEWLGATLLVATGFNRMTGLEWLPCLPAIWLPCGIIVRWLTFPLDCTLSTRMDPSGAGVRRLPPDEAWWVPLGLYLLAFLAGLAWRLDPAGPPRQETWLPVVALLVALPIAIRRGLAWTRLRSTDVAGDWKRCLRVTCAGLIGILSVHCHSLFVGMPFPAGTYVLSAALCGLITGGLAGGPKPPTWELPLAWNATVGLLVYAGLTVALLHLLPVVSYLD